METHVLTLIISCIGKEMNTYQGKLAYDTSAEIGHLCLNEIIHKVFIADRRVLSASHSLCVLPDASEGVMYPLLCLSAVIVYSGSYIQDAHGAVKEALKGWEEYRLEAIADDMVGIVMGHK